MNFKRFEILLPLNYNDGRPIEQHKFLDTNHELLEKFDALTTDTVEATGSWKYGLILYQDRLVRIRVDAGNPDDANSFFRQYKEVLKVRFEQLDIWITAHDIEVI